MFDMFFNVKSCLDDKVNTQNERIVRVVSGDDMSYSHISINANAPGFSPFFELNALRSSTLSTKTKLGVGSDVRFIYNKVDILMCLMCLMSTV